MGKLFDAYKVQDEEVRVVIMQTLVEVGRQEYDSVQFYFEKICEITAFAARNDDEKVGAQGIEFWTSLAEEEIRRRKINGNVIGYIARSATALVGLLLECLQKVTIDEDDEGDEEWGVALSAGCCLANVA